MSKSNARVEGIIENESCSTTWVDPKIVLGSYPNPKKNPSGPKKVKNYPKIKSNSKVRILGVEVGFKKMFWGLLM